MVRGVAGAAEVGVVRGEAMVVVVGVVKAWEAFGEEEDLTGAVGDVNVEDGAVVRPLTDPKR